jgi:HlyD family secretion protein
MKKKIIIIIISIVVVGIAVGIFFLTREKEKSVYYDTATVKQGSISTIITATGTVNPTTQVEVGTQVSGIIDKVYVDYNSQVKKGDLLAEIDRTVLEATLTSAQTDLASNKANLDFQQKNYTRVQQLYKEKAISDLEYESAEFDYLRAKYTYERSMATVTTAKTNLDFARIYSPIDGVVLLRAVDEGQTVAASFNTPTLFKIANDLTKMQVIANVDEADIGQVKAGQKVSFTVDAFPDDTFEGNVSQVRLEAVVTSNVVTYNVVIDAPNPDLKLMPGLTANVMVRTMYKDNILIIPSKALRFTPENYTGELPKLKPNEMLVWVLNDKEISPVAVEIGSRDAINFEVKSGLSEGMEVVLSIEDAPVEEQDNSQTTSNPFLPQRQRGMRMR